MSVVVSKATIMSYIGTTDPDILNKFSNIIESLFHKQEGKIVKTITELDGFTTITFSDDSTQTFAKKELIDILMANQTSGFVARKNLADLPALGDLDKAYLILDDEVSLNNNGTWGWNGSAYYQAVKTAETLAREAGDNNLQESIDNETNLRKQDVFDKAINFKGNNPVNNLLPQLSGMLTGGASFTFQEVTEAVEKLPLLPIDSDKVFRINYVVGSEMFLTLNSSLVLSNKVANYYGWVRKSDLLNLPDSFTFMIYSILGGANQDLGKLDYILPTDFVKGYTQSKTVGESTIKVDVLADTGEWLFFINTFTTTSNDTHFIPRIYISNVGVGQENKLDFLNLTAYCTQDNVNILLPSLKSGEIYVSALEKKINTEVITLNNSILTSNNNLIKADLDRAINLKGNKPALNGLPQLSGFLSGQGFTFSELLVDELLPIDTNLILKATYNVSGSGRIDPLGTPITLTNKKGSFYSWVRKSDIASLPNSLSVMMYTLVGTTNQDVITLDYIPKANFVKGYTQSKTIGNSTLKLDVLSDYNGWLLFYAEITTTSVTANNFYARFYIDGTGLGKIDFVNYTATNSLDNVNILLPSIKSSENIFYNGFIEVNVKNSNKILIQGDSYSGNEGGLPDKGYVSRVSERLPYRVVNNSKGGDDAIETILRVDLNELKYTSTGISLDDLENIDYCLIVIYANDSPYRYWDINFYLYNLKQLCLRLLNRGITPIISCEFFLFSFFSTNIGVIDTTGIQELCNELGIQFIDIYDTAQLFNQNFNSSQKTFYGSHPGTRRNSIFGNPIFEAIKDLQPKQSVKIFRNRVVEASFTNDTHYKDDIEKLQKYQEIRVGHYSLTDANLIKYDDLNNVASPQFEDRNDEYLMLENNDAVSFSRHALVEFTIPYNANDVDAFKIKISTNKTVFPWVRKMKAPFASTKGTSFKYTGTPTIVNGDTYTVASSDTGLNGLTITVTGNREGFLMALATNYAYRNINATGTLTRTSGTGTESISFTNVLATFVDDYYTNYNQLYEWVAPTNEGGGVYVIDNSTRQFVQGRKIVLLIRETTGFDLTDISLLLPKNENAEVSIYNLPYKKTLYKGASLLTQTKFDATALLDWTTTGTVTPIDAIEGDLPKGCTKVVTLDGTNSVSQTLDFSTNYNLERKTNIQLKLWCAYDPDLFVGENINDSVIKALSCDYAVVKITLEKQGINSPIQFRRLVSLGYQEILIDTFIPANFYDASVTPLKSKIDIKIECESKSIRLALADVITE